MAGPWTLAGWLTATDVKRIFGNHDRSTLLKAVDDAIDAYDQAPNALNFTALRTAFDAWSNSKTDPSKTIRNKTGAVDDLARWLVELEEATMPAAEVGWGGLANCYAYAMKCQAPGGNGTPVPGRVAGAPVLPYHPTFAGNRPAYWRALMAGIVADAAVANQVVVVHSQPTATGAMPQPDNPPIHLVGAGTYLAAMVVKTDGFHFLRRDSATGRWSHKNGAQDAEVETFATLAASGRPVVLDDNVFVTLVRTGQGTYRSSFPGFTFAGYLLVPSAGFAVS